MKASEDLSAAEWVSVQLLFSVCVLQNLAVDAGLRSEERTHVALLSTAELCLDILTLLELRHARAPFSSHFLFI